MDTDEITKIATDAADLIYEMSQPLIQSGMNLRFEYSPESFMGRLRMTLRSGAAWRCSSTAWQTYTA